MGIYDMHTVTLRTHPGYDTDNKMDGNWADTILDGWLEKKRNLVLDKNGEEIISSSNILIDENTTITHEDVLTIDSKDRQIVAIDQLEDFTRSKTRLYLK